MFGRCETEINTQRCEAGVAVVGVNIQDGVPPLSSMSNRLKTVTPFATSTLLTCAHHVVQAQVEYGSHVIGAHDDWHTVTAMW